MGCNYRFAHGKKILFLSIIPWDVFFRVAPGMKFILVTALCSRKFQNVQLRLDCWNLIVLLPLWFYLKSNFGELKRSKNVIFANFRHFEFWNWVNLELKNCSNLLKSQFRTSKIGKNGIFGQFEFAKIWFHVKSEWQ